jgi:alpha-N-arabinofuranosidase
MKSGKIIIAVLCVAGGLQAKELFVAKTGNDTNTGSAKNPLLTIQQAANVAQSGDTITVREGIYRERVNPPRGGTSNEQRIVYQAAPGEKVVIKGSELLKDWAKAENDTWKAVIPNSFFGDFNPYCDLIAGDWFNDKGRKHHTGAIYLNGDWLMEAASFEEVVAPVKDVSVGPALFNVAWFQIDGQADPVPAVRYAAQSGVKNAGSTEGGQCVGWIHEEDWVQYKSVDFGEGAEIIQFRIAGKEKGKIEMRAGDRDGDLLGVCEVPNSGDWQEWISITGSIKKTEGKKDICLVFKGEVEAKRMPPLWFAEVDDKNTTIWAQFKGVDPNRELVEMNVRQTVFYPEEPGRNYITVRGFTMQHAATTWAPPTAEQFGVIGTHWSKGWIIENNTVSHSKCVGITLGKYGDEFDNTAADTAEGYVLTIERAVERGWTREIVGSHLVRNNHIHSCEQAGIVGSLGAIFSTITGNYIHDISVHGLFIGAELAGIKLHAPIDTVISKNFIEGAVFGIWLDWMSQNARVTQNLFYQNRADDIFLEVNHGPCLVDNNLILSDNGIRTISQGDAYVHNLISKVSVKKYTKRETPYHKPHSTEIAGMLDNTTSDVRAYNNIVFGPEGFAAFDVAEEPMVMKGNVYVDGAKPTTFEKHSLLEPDFNPEIKVIKKENGVYLEMSVDPNWGTERNRKLITTELLGNAKVTDAPFVHPDGSPLKIDCDYFGNPRNGKNPFPGPFADQGGKKIHFKVWPIKGESK